MSLMKNMPLNTQKRFMARSSEVAKPPFNGTCDMRQSLCVRCVDTYITRWEM